MAAHNNFGKWAEEQACKLLKSKGYVILEQNYRYGKAEIDIIAQTQQELIIIEVKGRKSNLYGEPQLFVSPTKIKHLTKAANAYVQKKQVELPVRFDIITVTLSPEQIIHIENAFLMDSSNSFFP